MVDPSAVIELPSTAAQGDRQIPRDLLARIIHQRLGEILRMVQKEIAAAGYDGKLTAGVVLTGGAAALEGSTELAADVFGSGVRVGVPAERLTGLSDSIGTPRFSTAVGLAHYAASRLALGEPLSVREEAGRIEGVAGRLKHWLQEYW